MSHYTVIRTRMVDRQALAAALADLGFPTVEVHDEPQPLIGYRGDQRAQRAHVIVRRQHVGRASNDIGFARQQDGSYQALISRFDRARYNARWLERLHARYAYHATLAVLTRQHFEVVQENTRGDGEVRLVLRRIS
jgi:hypothetical protein